MANYPRNSVLSGLYRLTEKTNARKPRVITQAAIARETGLKTAYVKEVLEANQGALRLNDEGKITGAKVGRYAAESGLVFLQTKTVRGFEYFVIYFGAEGTRNSFCMEREDTRKQESEFRKKIRDAGKAIVTGAWDMPDDVLRKVWHEAGVPGPDHTETASAI
jgi:hypothetical protein